MNSSERLLALGPIIAVSGTLAAPKHLPGESMLPYLFVVYTITWIAFFAYAFFMSRGQQVLHRELEALRKLLEAKDKARTASGPHQPSQPSSQKPPT